MKPYWQPGQVYVTSFCPARNWREWRRKKPGTPQGWQNPFFPSDFPFHYLLEHVWLKKYEIAAVTQSGS